MVTEEADDHLPLRLLLLDIQTPDRVHTVSGTIYIQRNVYTDDRLPREPLTRVYTPMTQSGREWFVRKSLASVRLILVDV